MPPAIDLIFSGGGTRGVAFAGAMDVLEQKRPILRRLVGTSAGAIAAAYAAAGLTGREYLRLVPSREGDPFLFNSFFAPPSGDAIRASAARKDSDTRRLLRGAVDGAIENMLKGITNRMPRIGEMIQGAFALGKDRFYENAFLGFLDRAAEREPPGKIRTRTALFALIEFGGLYDPDLFRDWIVARFEKRLPRFDRATTLKQFHEMTADVGRELSVVIADTTDARALVLNHRTAPDCPVADAVLMSLSVPLVWPETEWPKAWGTYLGHDVSGHLMVDGGVLANFPIHYLMNQDADESKAIFGEPAPVNERPALIGLMLDDATSVPGDVAADPDQPEYKLIGRIGRLLGTMSAWQVEHVKGAADLICRIGCKGHPALEMSRGPATILRLQAMVNSGRCAMVEHLKKRKLF